MELAYHTEMTEITELNADIKRIVDVANAIDTIIRQEQDKQPYNMNIIDELHANENAHTRILLKLLQFPSDGTFPILMSFLHKANNILSDDTDKIGTDINNPRIVFGEEYIDGLIENNGQAIIIENKIHDAVDQDAQIGRYIEAVQKHGFKKNNIYVIYLTLNGSKEVEDYSLTEDAQKILNFSADHPGRFIKMNYRDHIIRWLKEDVLPYCCIKEDLLISAIKQYVDHLEGLTRTRKNNKNMNEKIKQEIYSKLNIDNSNQEARWNTLTEERNKVQEVLDALDNIRKEMSDSAYETLTETSVNTLKDILPNSTWKTNRAGSFVQILNEQWPDLIHFEWWPLDPDDFAKENHSFQFGFHLEGGYRGKRENVRNELYDTIKNVKDLQILNGRNLKHGSALFEKSYKFENTSFLNATPETKEEFFRKIYSEYTDFIVAFDNYINGQKD